MSIENAQQVFYSRWGKARPPGLAHDARGEEAFLQRRTDAALRFAPWWARGSIRNTFVGVAGRFDHAELRDDIDADMSIYQVPFISIHPRLTQIIAASIYFYQALREVTPAIAAAAQRGEDLDYQDQSWRDIPSWIVLISKIGDPATEARDANEYWGLAEIRGNEMPLRLKLDRPQLMEGCWDFILGHEYSHWLLGHRNSETAGAAESVVSHARAVLQGLEENTLDEESQADVLGLELAVFRRLETIGDMPSALKLINDAIGSVSALVIAAQVVGKKVRWVSELSSRTHPEPKLRFNTLSGMLQKRMETMCNWPELKSVPRYASSLEFKALVRSGDIIGETALALEMIEQLQEEREI